jgi:8-oxo-dGTP pyrophosphatase MutT (NUDIX family)
LYAGWWREDGDVSGKTGKVTPLLVRSKVFAYITRGQSILILEHPDHPDAGIQVPAGSLEHGESPRAGVLREAFEETGLTGLTIASFLGLDSFDRWPHYGQNEIHNRWFFHLAGAIGLPDSWEHVEKFASDGSEPIRFAFSWVDIDAVRLDWGHDAMLDRLRASLACGLTVGS